MYKNVTEIKEPDGYDLKAWALYYASLGLKVFPLVPREKIPPKGSHGFLDATDNIEQIEKWWNENPNYNIGCATGKDFSQVLAIDLDEDEEKNKHGLEVLAEWERENGELPETWRIITGRGGNQYFYHFTDSCKSESDICNGVDIRADGGYSVLPPSIHPNGNRYEWECGYSPEETDLLSAKGEPLKFITDCYNNNPQKKLMKKDETTRVIPEDEIITEGGRTQFLFDKFWKMRSSGLTEKAIRLAIEETNRTQCKPSLTGEELEKTIFTGFKREYLLPEKNKVTFVTFVTLPTKTKKQLPPFPIEGFPVEIREYIEAVAESLQVPVDMVAMAVLTIVSLCIQGKYQIAPKKDWIESLNLYSIVIGCPSERKSPVLKEVEAPIFEYMEKENERRKSDIAEYKANKTILSGKLKTINDSLMKGGTKTKYTVQDAMECQKKIDELEEVNELQLVLDDVTPEALVNVMKRNNERIGVVSAEGGVFGMMAGRYNNNTNIDIFLKGYSGEYYHSTRMSRSDISLKNPYLTILLMVQPQVISEIMENRDFRGKGLLARFLYSNPTSKVGCRTYRSKPVPDSVRATYKALLHELLNIDEQDCVERNITLSEEADNVAEKFSQWIEPRLLTELADIEDWAGKLHGNTMRIAGVLHVIKYGLGSMSVQLEENTMKSAIKIGMYLIEHAKSIFEDFGLSEPKDIKDAKYILSKLPPRDKCDKCDKTYISKRDLLRTCRRFEKIEEMEDGLNCLIEHGYFCVVKEKSSGKGRPLEKIYINPEYYKLKENTETDEKETIER